jgi:hypothetical protein
VAEGRRRMACRDQVRWGGGNAGTIRALLCWSAFHRLNPPDSSAVWWNQRRRLLESVPKGPFYTYFGMGA